MNIVINKTIGIGDAGLPFNVTIDVEYEQKLNEITVTDWMEDFFYDQDKDLNVTFI